MNDDVVIRPVEGEDGGYCSACNTIQPVAAFKYRLTFAETRARGYAGNHRLQVLSPLCKKCRPPDARRIKPSKMNRKQVHNAVEVGDIPVAFGKRLLDALDLKAMEGRGRGARARWAKERARKYAPLIFALNRDMATLHQQEKYARNKGRPEMLAYAVRYKAVLNNIRYRLRKDCDVLEIDPPKDWRVGIKPHEMDEIKELWSAIPNRNLLALPALLNPRYTPPEPKKKDTGGLENHNIDGVVVRNVRSIEAAKIVRARMEALEASRAAAEVRRAERMAQGEDVTPLPPPAPAVVAVRQIPPRLRTASDKVAEQATDDLLSDLGLNK